MEECWPFGLGHSTGQRSRVTLTHRDCHCLCLWGVKSLSASGMKNLCSGLRKSEYSCFSKNLYTQRLSSLRKILSLWVSIMASRGVGVVGPKSLSVAAAGIREQQGSGNMRPGCDPGWVPLVPTRSLRYIPRVFTYRNIRGTDENGRIVGLAILLLWA